jgi:hypothetical protein
LETATLSDSLEEPTVNELPMLKMPPPFAPARLCETCEESWMERLPRLVPKAEVWMPPPFTAASQRTTLELIMVTLPPLLRMQPPTVALLNITFELISVSRPRLKMPPPPVDGAKP